MTTPIFLAVIFSALLHAVRNAAIKGGRDKRIFIFGGSAYFVAYAIVVWAFTQAPIALLTALRETSIVFAFLIGGFF